MRFLLDRGFPIPSPAALGRIGDGYVRAIERFSRTHRIPVVRFKKGESKEMVARRFMRKAEREERFGVVMIGVAQEKTSTWRGFRQGGVERSLIPAREGVFALLTVGIAGRGVGGFARS